MDNGSTDTTKDIARSLADKVIDAGPERSAQRNAGILSSTGEFVFIIDSDMYLENDVVSACVRAADAGAEAVAIPEHSFGTGFWAKCKRLERSLYTHDGLTAAARFFPRTAINAVGLYDECLTGPEDWDMSIRVAGTTPPAFASAIIRHDEGALALGNLLRKKYYYGRSMPAFIAKHGREALRRITPFRSSLLRGVVHLLQNPILGAGTIFMKFCEYVAIVLGMLDRRLRRPETVYNADTSGSRN